MMYSQNIGMDHRLNFQSNNITPYSSRIMYDTLCQVCLDYSSGKHYGVFACDGCAGFFKRTVRLNRVYPCKSKNVGVCLVDKTHRNQCRACRLWKCLQVGMIDEFVQDERGPRKSTLRPQKSSFNNSSTTTTTSSHHNNKGLSLEIIDDTCPPSSVSTGSPITQSPLSGLITPPGLTPLPAFAPITIMTTTGDDTIPPQSVSTGQPTPSPTFGLTTQPGLSSLPAFAPVTMMTTSSISPPSAVSISPSSVYPYYHHQQPSNTHRPQIIDHSKPLITHSGPFLFAPKPKYSQPDVPITIPKPFGFSLETIYESASRLLVMNVRWVKSVQAFASLPSCDQIILLEESWSELFVLAAAQFALPIETGILMTAANMSGLFSSSPSSVSQITKFQETVAKFKQMNVDATEYACLRAVTLFKTYAGLRQIPSTINIRDEAQLTLSRYVSTVYPTQQLRFSRLMLLLPALRVISASTIKELFFRKTIGNTPIEYIISDIYKSRDL